MTDGIYIIPFEQYESIPAASKHFLDALAISPLHAWSYFLSPERPKKKETPALLLGNAIHVSILEPERFEQEYVREPSRSDFPKDWEILDTLDDYKRVAKKLGLKVTGTKAQLKDAIIHSGYGYALSNFWDSLRDTTVQGKMSLSVSDWYTVKAITHRVRKHPAASELFKFGKAEQSIFWTDPDTGVKCKSRIDWLQAQLEDETGLIVDLKSTNDASPNGFQRSIGKYRYYVQAAMYIDGFRQVFGFNPQAFVFAAWEKYSPYASALYYASDDMVAAGRAEYKRLLRIYADCLEKDEWRGYSDEIVRIDLPENFKPTSPESELDSDWLSEMESV